MKAKSVFVAAIFFLFPIVAQAQWHFGGIFDLNVSSFNVDPKPITEEYSSRLGFGLGVVVDRDLTENIDIHAEAMFLQKGGRIEDLRKRTLRHAYFEIPILIRYFFNVDAESPFYVMAGPSLGILLKAEIEIDGTGFDNKDEINGLDFGFAFGGGARKPYGDKTLFAEARYVLGLATINADSNNSTVKQNGFQLAFGVMIPVGK